MSRGHGQAQRWVLDQLAEGPMLIQDLARLYMLERSEAAGHLAGNFSSALSSVRRAVRMLAEERLVAVAWFDEGPDSQPCKAVRLITWQDVIDIDGGP